MYIKDINDNNEGCCKITLDKKGNIKNIVNIGIEDYKKEPDRSYLIGDDGYIYKIRKGRFRTF